VDDAHSRTRRCNYIQKHPRTHIDTSTPRTILEAAPSHITLCRHRGTVGDKGYMEQINNDPCTYIARLVYERCANTLVFYSNALWITSQ
jgi:hypothetical protein